MTYVYARAIESRVAWLLAVVWGIGVVAGCSKKPKECNDFITTVNAALQEIDSRPKPQGADMKAVARENRDLAERYDRLAESVQKLEISTPQLQQHAEQYRDMATKAAATLREVALAVEKLDSETAKRKHEQFEQVAKKEDELVAGVNALCLEKK
jgi:outer membrane murein-binding lipoprotein Lpp